MADDSGTFRYVAMDSAGSRVRGVIKARDDQYAFRTLRSKGLTPVRIARSTGHLFLRTTAVRLSDTESAEILTSLADLLSAGADIRTSLGILAARSERAAVRQVCQNLSDDISRGEALDGTFARNLAKQHGFVAALVASGEASGDLPDGLRRAGKMLEAGVKMREQLVSALAYPAFVMASTFVAASVILFLVVPTIQPLAEEGGGKPAGILALMIAVSTLLRENLLVVGLSVVGLIALIVVAVRSGLFRDQFEEALLFGPFGKVVGAIAYGGFSVALGSMLSAGAPVSEALRLAVRSVRSNASRRRLEPVAYAVRQGETLSTALQRVHSFPASIVRLTAVGEEAGALGPMLRKAGDIEQRMAIRKIEAAARLLGPAMIILLGAMIGLMMGGLLSGVTNLGQAALE